MSDLRRLIHQHYPTLEILTKVEIAGRGPTLIVYGHGTQALVSSRAELERWFGRVPCPQLVPSGKCVQRSLF